MGADDAERIRAWENVPLNAAGKKEVQQLAQLLAALRLRRILTSDLDRAKETGKAIQQANPGKPPLLATVNLRAWNLGDLTGKRIKDVEPELERLMFADRDQKPPGGESYNTFLRRFLRYFAAILQDAIANPKGVLVVVTHARNIRSASAWLRGGQEGIHVDAAALREKEQVAPGQFMALTYDGTQWHAAGPKIADPSPLG